MVLGRRVVSTAADAPARVARRDVFDAAVFCAGLATGAILLEYVRPRKTTTTSKVAVGDGASASATTTRAETSPSVPEPTGAAAVWRGTFDPGSNPRVVRKAVEPGPSYYDRPEPEEGRPAFTVWEQLLRAENIKRTNFSALDRNGDGFLDGDDLRRAYGVSMDVDALIAAADSDGLGRVSYKDWLVLKAKLADAHERAERAERAGRAERAERAERAVASTSATRA